MKWTSEQRRGIFEADKNILVSAGAGSGKTAVLSERVIEKIKQGIRVDELVVLTFTNAAAKEMILRIRKKLQQETSPRAQQAIATLDAAHIQTFDSYALFIVKKYGYLKNISKQVSIGDPIRMQLESKRILDALFLDYYEREDPDFLAYIKTFEIKDDATLKEQIRYFHTQLSLFSNFDQTLSKYKDTFFTDTHFENVFHKYVLLVHELIEALKDHIEDIENHTTNELALPYLDAINQTFTPLYSEKSYDKIVNIIATIDKIPDTRSIAKALRSDDDEATLTYLKDTRKSLKDLFDDIKTLAQKDKASHYKDFMLSHTHIPLIASLIKQFHDRLMRFQIEKEIMDFSTVAQLAIEIVKENHHVRTELTESIHEIMIDEYQDTNKLQESFIALIANNNVYQVGDVKQSIYRFRHAEPQLFTDKYKSYQQSHTSDVIDLNDNFRSRKEMLSDINSLFKHTMDEEIGGIDYEGKQMLSYGNKTYDKNTSDKSPYGLKIKTYTDVDVEDYLEKKQLTLEEMEFFYIADDIRQKVGVYDVYDTDLETLRKARYDDFAILVSVSSKFEAFKKIFESKGIPLSINRSEPFMNYIDIDLYRNILKLVYCFVDDAYYKTHMKHSFLSVARSYLNAFTDDQIINQTLDIKASNPKDLTWVNDIFKPVIEPLFDLANRYRALTLPDLWNTIVTTYNLKQKTIHLPHTKSAIDRLDYLTTLINTLADDGYTLKDLVMYFDEIIKGDFDVEFTTYQGSTKDKVQMMTIHKSKGLEFPIVYIPSLHRAWNRSTMKNYAFSEQYGFLIPHEDDGLRESFLYDLHKESLLKDDTSERLRILYVATTRAKELCIMPVFNKEKRIYHYNDEDRVKAFERRRYYKNFNDVILSILPNLNHLVESISLNDYELDAKFNRFKKMRDIDITDVPKKTYAKALEKTSLQTPKHFSSQVSTLLDKTSLEWIDKGNQLHHYLETIDFTKPIHPQIDILTKNKEDKKSLQAFFEHPFMQSLSVKTAYKEFPFMIEDDDNVTSGFIDLLLETHDKLIIIDYKLKSIDKTAYLEQISGYKAILATMSDKPIEGYLYSIVDQVFKKVI